MRVTFRAPAAAAALTVIVAGGGYALATRISPGTIHACANNKTGALRLARRCHRDERAITWNKAGLQGHPGATGAPGPSDGYAAGSQSLSDAGAPSTALTLPPGDYSVTGQCEAEIEASAPSSLAFGLASEQLTLGPLDQATLADHLGEVQASVPNEGFTGASLASIRRYRREGERI